MDDVSAEQFHQRFDELVDRIRQNPALTKRLPEVESRMVREALDGQDASAIAQNHHVSEGYVWTLMTDLARQTTGGARQAEQAGLGSDTAPGVTGGYGRTGFGNLSQEPPVSGTDQSYEIDESDELSRDQSH